ncbi:hypothetical protein Dimus_025657 [Dionaea muscipula]
MGSLDGSHTWSLLKKKLRNRVIGRARRQSKCSQPRRRFCNHDFADNNDGRDITGDGGRESTAAVGSRWRVSDSWFSTLLDGSGNYPDCATIGYVVFR